MCSKLLISISKSVPDFGFGLAWFYYSAFTKCWTVAEKLPEREHVLINEINELGFLGFRCYGAVLKRIGLDHSGKVDISRMFGASTSAAQNDVKIPRSDNHPRYAPFICLHTTSHVGNSTEPINTSRKIDFSPSFDDGFIEKERMLRYGMVVWQRKKVDPDEVTVCM